MGGTVFTVSRREDCPKVGTEKGRSTVVFLEMAFHTLDY